MSSKIVSQTDYVAAPGPLILGGKNATLHEVMCTYFHLMGTCAAEKFQILKMLVLLKDSG